MCGRPCAWRSRNWSERWRRRFARVLAGLWERYVESQVDYRAGGEVLARKFAEAGSDAWQLLEWLRQAAQFCVGGGAAGAVMRGCLTNSLRSGRPGGRRAQGNPVAASSTPAVSEGLEAAAHECQPPPVQPKPQPRRATPSRVRGASTRRG